MAKRDSAAKRRPLRVRPVISVDRQVLLNLESCQFLKSCFNLLQFNFLSYVRDAVKWNESKQYFVFGRLVLNLMKQFYN